MYCLLLMTFLDKLTNIKKLLMKLNEKDRSLKQFQYTFLTLNFGGILTSQVSPSKIFYNMDHDDKGSRVVTGNKLDQKVLIQKLDYF